MLWDTQSGQHIKTLSGHDGWIRGLVFHPTGKYLMSVSDDKHMRVWEMATGRCTKKIQAHEHFVSCIAWGNVGGNGGGNEKRRVNVVATGGIDLAVNIWTP